MPRPRRSLHRIRFLVLLVSLGLQLPALRWLSLRVAEVAGGLAYLPYLVAALLSLPYLVLTLRQPFSDEPKPRWLRALSLWPFFTWWATSAIYCALFPLVWLATRAGDAESALPFGLALGVSALGGLWAVRRTPRLVELEVQVAGLPTAFDGYRIGQISDVHCGSFTPRSRVEAWVAQLNAQRPDLIAVTGDLVTSGDHFVDDVASALGDLDATDGVYACMGNHDYFCDAERLVSGLREGGVQVLRNEGTVIEREGARLFVAGIEDAWTRRHDLARTLAERRSDDTVLLLAHDPNHIAEASAAGVALQLSGHTHGGQMALPVGGGRYNLARLITRYTHGLYRQGPTQLYVNRGAGTTGPPVRLFAPAELTVLTLRAASI